MHEHVLPSDMGYEFGPLSPRKANDRRYDCEIIHEPEHYNRNCGCMIPGAWVALVYDNVDLQLLPKWPCGDTKEEAIDNVCREYRSNVRFI